MQTVPLYGPKAAGRVALVDDADYGLVMAYRWNVSERIIPGHRPQGPYVIANAKRADGRNTSVRMHCLILGVKGVDHKDHNPLNNQRSNLRAATGTQNSANQRSHLSGSSQYKGVSYYKAASKWGASIRVGGNAMHLGRFAVEEEAARAYDAAAREAWGEFAYLNFPDLPPLVIPAALCQECGGAIPSDLRAGTKFCCGACRREDSLRREAEVRRARNGWRKRARSRY